MTSKLIEDLNLQQQEAVQLTKGPLLIIAGPGSGKTRVITHRIAYLIRVCGVPPRNIAVVTFTNKAANELKERLHSMLGQDSIGITASTFHSLCARILRHHGSKIGLENTFTIYDDSDQITTIKRSMKELGVDPKHIAPRAIQSAISNAKSQLIETSGFKCESYFDEVVLRVFHRYEELLTLGSGVDFDDLLLKTYSLFKNIPSVAHEYQDRFTYLMIDEFQDTNIAQYEISKQLSDKHHNLCVVGDPDQSIYSWRNADIRNILTFQRDNPDTKVISLEENYRSTQTILDAAQHIISSNKKRIKKSLWTNNGIGYPITIGEGYNENEEADIVLKTIQTLKQKRSILTGQRYTLNDIAIMYRVNAQSRALEDVCLKYSIPYQLIGGIKFYQRQEIRDIIGFLRIVLNPDDDAALSRVINVPARGIGKKTVTGLVQLSMELNLSMFSVIELIDHDSSSEIDAMSHTIKIPNLRSSRSLKTFVEMIKTIQVEADSLNLAKLITIILDRTGYKTYILGDPDRGLERWENIQEFINSTESYLDNSSINTLSEFLESIALVNDIDNLQNQKDTITLITLHQAKGLEFPIVFIIGMEEGLLPHARSMDKESELEEERRLAYVGITRAKERLYLMRAFRRGFRGGSEPSIPSRYLSEIPDNLIDKPSQSSVTRFASTEDTELFNNPSETAGSLNRSSKHRSHTDKHTFAHSVESPELSFRTGDKVIHNAFGEGLVINCVPSGGDFELTVAFKVDHGIKRLLLSLAPIRKVK